VALIGGEKIPQAARGGVTSNQATDMHGLAERAKVSRNVRRAARIRGFALHFDDRYGSFRGNPGNLSPYEFIQHDISNDQQPLRAGSIKKLLYSFNIH
jgi:hypothetical protein